MNRRALIFYGGWEGHQPVEMAELTRSALKESDFEVEMSDSLECLDDGGALREFDLIVPCWTMGELEPKAVENLSAAVQAGTGRAGFHGGMGDA
ncbi:MAG: ThuA domain-containing protein, partial [Chthoniobacterales bacterium]